MNLIQWKCIQVQHKHASQIHLLFIMLFISLDLLHMIGADVLSIKNRKCRMVVYYIEDVQGRVTEGGVKTDHSGGYDVFKRGSSVFFIFFTRSNHISANSVIICIRIRYFIDSKHNMKFLKSNIMSTMPGRNNRLDLH